jgi:hypothetical protein
MNATFPSYLALTVALSVILSLAEGAPLRGAAQEIFVSPAGNDENAGTREMPLATLAAARDLARKTRTAGVPQSILLAGGAYYLAEPLTLEAADSGTAGAPVVYSSLPGEEATISGGRRLDLRWRPYKNGIYQADVPGKEKQFVIDQLFINGERQHMARYPNYDPAVRNYGGTAADAISPARVKTWANPLGGLVHGLHVAQWGDFHYRIIGVDAFGRPQLEGGWQNNRPMGMHRDLRFVENIFEELDAPGEWYFDREHGTLYVFPPAGIELSKARIESAGLKRLIDLHGGSSAPVRYVTFRNLIFTHAARTFLEPYEPLLRSDWCIHRGAAVMFDGTEDCALESCFLRDVGGNAVFASNYNRRLLIKHCKIVGAGASAVCFVGDARAARFEANNYNSAIRAGRLDTAPGPRGDNYPAYCRVEDCLLCGFGVYEKQTAGVEIDLADSITVSHASIYDCPRAGINIGDGCWGGHVIEFCDVFDTVKETGDHGSFNSWGRDRFWHVDGRVRNRYPDMPLWDCRKPISLRNNRWRCDHGWDIDLDDGSSNYRIENNLCLNGGMKFREGYARAGENNVLVNNTFHPHVWYPESGDVFRHNIVTQPYAPVGMPAVWGKEVDENLLPGESLLAESRKHGRDLHSLAGDPQFADAAHGDYRVGEQSPALKIGFKNFPMDQFGVASADLRREARTPEFGAKAASSRGNERVHDWLGAKAKTVTTLGEVSAAGLSSTAGVILLEVPQNCAAAKAGLKPIDVIIEADGKPVRTFRDLERLVQPGSGRACRLQVMRGQKPQSIEVRL